MYSQLPRNAIVAEGAESGGKDRQIRRLFHPDVQILRIYSGIRSLHRRDPPKNDLDLEECCF